MAEYRVYEIGDGDHIVKATPMVCGDDNEAIIKARELAEGHVVEVWNKARFVARLDADDQPSPPANGPAGSQRVCTIFPNWSKPK